jgi:hypothetical protein
VLPLGLASDQEAAHRNDQAPAQHQKRNPLDRKPIIKKTVIPAHGRQGNKEAQAKDARANPNCNRFSIHHYFSPASAVFIAAFSRRS